MITKDSLTCLSSFTSSEMFLFFMLMSLFDFAMKLSMSLI